MTESRQKAIARIQEAHDSGLLDMYGYALSMDELLGMMAEMEQKLDTIAKLYDGYGDWCPEAKLRLQAILEDEDD